MKDSPRNMTEFKKQQEHSNALFLNMIESVKAKVDKGNSKENEYPK